MTPNPSLEPTSAGVALAAQLLMTRWTDLAAGLLFV